jgi:hypothetical protein
MPFDPNLIAHASPYMMWGSIVVSALGVVRAAILRLPRRVDREAEKQLAAAVERNTRVMLTVYCAADNDIKASNELRRLVYDRLAGDRRFEVTAAQAGVIAPPIGRITGELAAVPETLALGPAQGEQHEAAPQHVDREATDRSVLDPQRPEHDVPRRS